MTQVKFCPFCGTKNALTAIKCANPECGEALPASVPIRPAPQQASGGIPTAFSSQANYIASMPAPTLSWWQSLSPAARAAIILLFFNAGLQSVSSSIPGLGFVVTAPFQVLSYFGQGILVGKLAKEDFRFQQEGLVKQAIDSVIWSTSLSLLIQFVLLLGLGAVTLGGILLALPLILALQLGSILLHACFAALGAHLYQRTGGKNLLKISLLVGTASFLGVCGLISGFVALLAGIGYSLFT